ncbi:MAG TPA: hypothetical protein VKE96_21720 [Vicinamibacterales bacterium]|nr:hypothetical protein [Vicinamibacterales bacterium]
MEPTGPSVLSVPSVPQARAFWRALVVIHRWLGIAGCLLFAAWFASGIVMMYVRMPELRAGERLARKPRVDFSTARMTPADLVRAIQSDPAQLRLTMTAGRPAYRVLTRGRWYTIMADSGRRPAAFTPDQALAAAKLFAPDRAQTLRYEGRITEPDQWTLQSRAFLPLHRIALGDPDGTIVYISDLTGEPEMKTTARERRWAYVGPVLHWLYFTPLRRHSNAWAQTIIWLSTAGVVMCLSGLVWGVSVARRSPYSGLMKWHHYAGLIFGATTCTFIFSGLLSMDPFDWHPSTAPTRDQREAVAGGSARLDALSIDLLRRSVTAIADEADATELEMVQFERQLYLKAGDRMVPALAPGFGTIRRFDTSPMLAAAHAAMPGVAVQDYVQLTSYDSYYYDRDGTLPLPVYRVRFADPRGTWLYLDPSRGAIVRKEERLSRANRWLYHGLHSLDFPFLYWRRPLWDVVMIVLCVGGLASAVTSVLPALRRLRRLGRR